MVCGVLCSWYVVCGAWRGACSVWYVLSVVIGVCVVRGVWCGDWAGV